jgi:hypothetical protein
LKCTHISLVRNCSARAAALRKAFQKNYSRSVGRRIAAGSFLRTRGFCYKKNPAANQIATGLTKIARYFSNKTLLPIEHASKKIAVSIISTKS